MKKSSKIILIVILSILAIILINLLIFLLINNKRTNTKLFNIGSTLIYQNEFNLEEINNINISLESENIEFRQNNESNKIEITAYGIEGEKLKADLKNGELNISKENNVLCFFCFDLNKKVIVNLPNEYDKKITLKTSSGNVDLKNVNTKKSNIEMQTTSGDINVINANNAILKSTSGDIKIDECSIGYISTTSGKIDIGQINEANLESTSGDIKVENIKEKCNIKATSGKIKVNDSTINQNSGITSVSGDITIVNKDDIYYDTETVSGDVKIEKNNNRKSDIELKLKTTSGNINIKE